MLCACTQLFGRHKLTIEATRRLCVHSPRVSLFDRPRSEAGAIILGSGCVWREACPTLTVETSSTEAEAERAAILSSMPAVEVFAVVLAPGQATSYYPFTSAYYESNAYKAFCKHHFSEFVLPRTMADAGADALDTEKRSALLWDPRYIGA